jgi:hypothetical protein
LSWKKRSYRELPVNEREKRRLKSSQMAERSIPLGKHMEAPDYSTHLFIQSS